MVRVGTEPAVLTVDQSSEGPILGEECWSLAHKDGFKCNVK